MGILCWNDGYEEPEQIFVMVMERSRVGLHHAGTEIDWSTQLWKAESGEVYRFLKRCLDEGTNGRKHSPEN
jgi:hypothetical protein